MLRTNQCCVLCRPKDFCNTIGQIRPLQYVRAESVLPPTTDIVSEGRLLAPEIEPRGLSFVNIPRGRLLRVGRAPAWPTVARDRRHPRRRRAGVGLRRAR